MVYVCPAVRLAAANVYVQVAALPGATVVGPVVGLKYVSPPPTAPQEPFQ